MDRPPLPPFSAESAARKARLAEDAWNSRDPDRVCLAYTEDSQWRNRSELFSGRAAIRAFLTRKWESERDYRLIKEVWAFHANRIAVRFVYESVDVHGLWTRSHGNEQWEFIGSALTRGPMVLRNRSAPRTASASPRTIPFQFDEHGLMRRREASINDVRIREEQRLFRGPLGPRPDDHPGLGELGL